jgi:predicted metalloprotease
MRFDEDSQLDTSQVQDTRGSRIRGAPVAIGGGAGVLGIVIYLLVNLLGGSTGALPGIDQVQVEGDNSQLEQECKTGQDANTKQDCRVVAVVNSVQTFWTQEFERRGGSYQTARTQLFSGATQSGCGAASSETGPFYCPADGTVYIDLSFYGELQSRFGARGGPFAQAYVLAHEYGHHVQNLLGTTERVARDRRTGPQRPKTTSPTGWTRPPPSATTASRRASRAGSTASRGHTAPPSSASAGSRSATAAATCASATPSRAQSDPAGR